MAVLQVASAAQVVPPLAAHAHGDVNQALANKIQTCSMAAADLASSLSSLSRGYQPYRRYTLS
jgi:hypothetical protein